MTDEGNRKREESLRVFAKLPSFMTEASAYGSVGWRERKSFFSFLARLI